MKQTFRSLLPVVSIAVMLSMAGPGLAQNNVPTETRRITAPPSVDRPYDVLHIKAGGSKVVNPDTGNTIFRQGPDRRFHWELIEMALYHAHVTVIPSGTVKLNKTIEIPTSYTTLIIGPDAKLVGNKDESIGAVIENVRRNNVNIFNFGTLDTGGKKGVPVMTDGRSGGKLGVRGGVLVSTGTLKGTHTGYWLVDVSNLHVPLMWSRKWGNGLLIPEGTEDVEAGFVAGLLVGEATSGQGETIDVQPRNKRFRVDYVAGSLVKDQDEILDINNSPNTRINKAVAFGDVNINQENVAYDGSQFIDITKYGARKNRRQTQKVWLDRNSPGTSIGDTRLVQKDVTKWKTSVKLPGFPNNLPILKVKARLTAVFEDGSSEQVFAKNFLFDLINRTNRKGGVFPGK